jgi:hypothetical protein
VVKFIPDANSLYDDDDIVNIPEEYADVVVYDTAYRILQNREDDRWQAFKQEL